MSGVILYYFLIICSIFSYSKSNCFELLLSNTNEKLIVTQLRINVHVRLQKSDTFVLFVVLCEEHVNVSLIFK